jgi:exopolysaccharide production protein ExoY
MQESIARLRPESASRVLEKHSQFSAIGGPWKRAFDVAMAVVALLLLMPLMLAAAVVIRLFTDGSLIASERLIGRGGATFVGYRLRLPGANPKTTRWANRVAESFRASSLDKLPQLFNVVRGDMSLVGPRPRAPAEFSDYFAQAPECLLARPGLISIWQSYNPPSSDQQTEIALERHYVSNWSARLDFALLSKIILAARNTDERKYAA